MRKFYKSRAGKAVIGKLPQMIQNLTQILLTEMQVVTPKVRALQEEYTAKLVEAEKPPAESAKAPQAN